VHGSAVEISLGRLRGEGKGHGEGQDEGEGKDGKASKFRGRISSQGRTSAWFKISPDHYKRISLSPATVGSGAAGGIMESRRAVVVRSGFDEPKVESYAGYKGEETARAVVLDGKRYVVASVLSRKRVLDSGGGRVREVWRCRLEDGRTVTVERLESDIWRVSTAI
jgi:hypothetical protein